MEKRARGVSRGRGSAGREDEELLPRRWCVSGAGRALGCLWSGRITFGVVVTGEKGPRGALRPQVCAERRPLSAELRLQEEESLKCFSEAGVADWFLDSPPLMICYACLLRDCFRNGHF